jgi:photosystem II stability/assembly factor-like uncharacterized protein
MHRPLRVLRRVGLRLLLWSFGPAFELGGATSTVVRPAEPASTAAPAPLPYRFVKMGADLRHVVVLSGGRRAFAVGDRGTLLVTDDAGGRWIRHDRIPTEQPLWGLWFEPAGQIGFAVGDGGAVIRTVDGGVHWDKVKGIPTENSLRSIAFDLAGRLGVIVGDNGAVLRSVDGGLHWVEINDVPTQDILSALWLAPSGLVGFAVGDHRHILSVNGSIIPTTLLRTDDGGLRWSRMENIPTTESLHAIRFTSSGRTGFAVGDNGTILRTDDGSVSWTKIPEVPTNETLYSVWCDKEARVVVVVGGEEKTLPSSVTLTSRTILLSSDSGFRWRRIDVPAKTTRVDESAIHNRLSSIAFDSEGRVGFAVGAGGAVLHSDNGGFLWSRTEGLPFEGHYRSVWIDPHGKFGYAVGVTPKNLPPRGVLFRTIDGGMHWEDIEGFYSNEILHSVWFDATARIGHVTGERGILLRSEDRGLHWSQSKGPGLKQSAPHYGPGVDRHLV